jgi:hypothetical protein
MSDNRTIRQIGRRQLKQMGFVRHSARLDVYV